MAENLAQGLEVGRATTLPPTHLSANIARATRGPISAERAVQLFEQSVHRDDVVYVLLRYAQQFFDFVGIFSISKEGARGRMAHGAGLSQELMEHVVIPLSGAGLFARSVRDKRALPMEAHPCAPLARSSNCSRAATPSSTAWMHCTRRLRPPSVC